MGSSEATLENEIENLLNILNDLCAEFGVEDDKCSPVAGLPNTAKASLRASPEESEDGSGGQ